MFNSIDEGFCVIEMLFDEHENPIDYRFLEVNPAFEQQTGLHDATGKRMRELNPDIEAHWFEIYGKVALTGEAIRFSNEAKALDGRWFDVYAFAHGGPQSHRVALLFNNITARKQAEQALDRLNATLERRVLERTQALGESEVRQKQATDAAVTANRAKSDFLSTISHEIRTPFNGMLGMTELLLTEHLTPQQRQYGELAHASGKTLLALVNDLLDIGKIEAGQLDVEHIPFSLNELLSELTDLYTLRAHEKGLIFLAKKAPDVPKDLLGDPGHLRQILNNLLDNALKFTKSGEIGLSVERLDGDGHSCRLRFAVHDSGIGIAAEAQPRLFTRFTQIDRSITSAHGGSGLGLAIVKQLCKHLGGQVALSSTPGQGSVFSCDLPFAVDEPPMPEPEPVLDGYGATEQIRAQGYLLPIIALTANAASADRDKCLQLGMNDYVSKPFSIAALRETLTRWIP